MNAHELALATVATMTDEEFEAFYRAPVDEPENVISDVLVGRLIDCVGDAPDFDGEACSPFGEFARLGRFVLGRRTSREPWATAFRDEDDAERDFSQRQQAYDAWEHHDLGIDG